MQPGGGGGGGDRAAVAVVDAEEGVGGKAAVGTQRLRALVQGAELLALREDLRAEVDGVEVPVLVGVQLVLAWLGSGSGLGLG